MKYAVALISLLLSLYTAQASAQTAMSPEMTKMMQKMQNMTPAERAAYAQNMQAQAQKMQQCMHDAGDMNALHAKSQEMQSHLQELCKAGKEEEAKAYAIEKGKEMANDPQIKKMQACSKDMMASMPALKMATEQSIAQKQGQSVCESVLKSSH